jgi:hypothetical protein
MTGAASDAGGAIPSIDALQAGLFCLMTRYAAAPSVAAAGAVVEQLTALCRHPQLALLPIQSHAYGRLLNEWRVLLGWDVEPRGMATRR